MDNIVLILVVIAIVALVLAVIYARLENHAMTIYERRNKADAEYTATVMKSARAESTRHGTFIVRGIAESGQVDYEFIPANGTPAVTDTDVNWESAHRVAVEIVSASRKDDNGKGRMLIAGNKWPSQEQWQNAINYLKRLDLVVATNKGTEVKRGDLDTLMSDLAINALPRRAAG